MMIRRSALVLVGCLAMSLSNSTAAFAGGGKGSPQKVAYQKGEPCCQGRCHFDKRHHFWHEPPNAPILASTPAVLAPLVLTPVAAQRRPSSSALEDVLRAWIEERSDNTGDSAAAAAVDDNGRSKADPADVPRPEPVGTVNERLLEMNKTILGLQRDLRATLIEVNKLKDELKKRNND